MSHFLSSIITMVKFLHLINFYVPNMYYNMRDVPFLADIHSIEKHKIITKKTNQLFLIQQINNSYVVQYEKF